MAEETSPAKTDNPEHQDESIKARKVELFEERKEETGGLRKPFSVYLLQTSAAPLSPAVKASLWATGALVTLIFLAAMISGGRIKHRKRQADAAPARPAAVASVAWRASAG